VKRFKVGFRPAAGADLIALYDYIADEAGENVAGAYIARMEAACRGLANFPHRGTPRDHIRPGLRTMGFERRATIVVQVMESEVVLVRIFYGGRDYETALLRGIED